MTRKFVFEKSVISLAIANQFGFTVSEELGRAVVSIDEEYQQDSFAQALDINNIGYTVRVARVD